MKFHCPKCKGTDLRVCISVVTRLLQDDDGNIRTIDDDRASDHEWDGASVMLCNECEFTAQADYFDTTTRRQLRQAKGIAALRSLTRKSWPGLSAEGQEFFREMYNDLNRTKH